MKPVDEIFYYKKPVLGFAAYSGTGKTQLIEKLIPLFKTHGLKVACIKVTHHDFEIDKKGKDSDRLRKAGASQTLLASANRIALVVELEQKKPPNLLELLARVDSENTDIILVEGFRDVAFPKIEIHRPSLKADLLYKQDKTIIAVASDEKIAVENIVQLNLNQATEVFQFVLAHFKISQPT